ncbi:ABC transporter permease [Aldersonia kunmingensis]|uniref:ABC transporter permease n=1 Tax=Aldersonia kunmingensis TaxID=408066 RepID=UPI0008357CEC|nr:ABC transporter permease [Aldersonia kunmingensis]
MSTMTYVARDSATMLRRNLVHIRRYPSLTIMLVAQPILLLLLFTFVFGGTMGDGLTSGGGREAYLVYITPAILVMAVASVASGTSISVAMDMTEGIVARFKTMAIARGSLLTGHVLGAMIQTLFVVVVTGVVAVLLGYRVDGGPAGLLAAFGVLAMLAFATTWLAVMFGVTSKSVETASNWPILLVLLPFLGSGFVPTESMPTAIRWFAEYQPFTPVIETLRAFLDGTPLDATDGLLAVAWCAGLALVGYLVSRKSFAPVG